MVNVQFDIHYSWTGAQKIVVRRQRFNPATGLNCWSPWTDHLTHREKEMARHALSQRSSVHWTERVEKYILGVSESLRTLFNLHRKR